MPRLPGKPSAAHIAWVKHLSGKIPGDSTSVFRHYDETEKHCIDIFTSENAQGIVAATVGLMDCDQALPGRPPLATEILLDSRGRVGAISNIAATIAFYVIKNGWRVAPGVTFADMVSMYEPQLRVKHVIFLPTFQWDEGMTRVDVGVRIVYPLLAIPITDAELELVDEQGQQSLTDRWTCLSTDVLDWTREGVA